MISLYINILTVTMHPMNSKPDQLFDYLTVI